MVRFLRNRTYPIGVDMGNDYVKMVQLGQRENGLTLLSGGSEIRPKSVEPGSASWQRWAIEALEHILEDGKFRGKGVIAAMPANEVLIDHMKAPKINDDKLQDAVFSEIRHKMPIEFDDVMIKYILTENDNIMVIATEREKIDRHLAIYEKAHLAIKSIGVWPIAMANSYARFFGTRKSDIETIVMLVDIETEFTNIVICRHKNPLFAYTIPMGAKHIDTDTIISKLVFEINVCRRQFRSMYGKVPIERLIFLSGTPSGAMGDKDKYRIIATQLEMPAQMGDYLAAVKIEDPYTIGVDKSQCELSWVTAFGLSLTHEQMEKCRT